MAAHTRGVIKDLELGTFIPRAKARPNPAPANSRLETQLKKVMICLRQCCSPSVRVILAFSARSRMMKRPMLATRPIIPCGCSWLGQHARLVASWVSANLAGEEGRTHHCKAARGEHVQGHVNKRTRGRKERRARFTRCAGCASSGEHKLLRADVVAGTCATSSEPGPRYCAHPFARVVDICDSSGNGEAKVCEDAQHVDKLPPKVIGSVHVFKNRPMVLTEVD